MNEHLYIITCDISCPKRWRLIFKALHGYGEWLQLSVFQCRLSLRRHAELIATLDEIIHHKSVTPKVVSLGKDFQAVEKEPIIV